jgi:hypothetical protein
MTSRRTIIGGIAMTVAGSVPLSPQFLRDKGSTIQLSPSGDATGATDTARLNRALASYPVVQMLPGDFSGGTLPTVCPCRSWQDGRAGGTAYAGFGSAGCLSRVVGTGCVTAPDATGAAYGARETTGSYGMCFTGSHLPGTAGVTHDDGSNTNALVNQSPVPF